MLAYKSVFESKSMHEECTVPKVSPSISDFSLTSAISSYIFAARYSAAVFLSFAPAVVRRRVSASAVQYSASKFWVDGGSTSGCGTVGVDGGSTSGCGTVGVDGGSTSGCGTVGVDGGSTSGCGTVGVDGGSTSGCGTVGVDGGSTSGCGTVGVDGGSTSGCGTVGGGSFSTLLLLYSTR
ncbi:keratin-associated protein 5-5-like [Oreochromis niloticus]|uniref:keratin-associated protein 5-5-like n=1 Tax=Oreochromis niloticus TaxID=8128 RepID=UPI000DF33B24|nr:keratin-associated protein 5-5-like [Oreochromis niloticus]